MHPPLAHIFSNTACISMHHSIYYDYCSIYFINNYHVNLLLYACDMYVYVHLHTCAVKQKATVL